MTFKFIKVPFFNKNHDIEAALLTLNFGLPTKCVPITSKSLNYFFKSNELRSHCWCLKMINDHLLLLSVHGIPYLEK